MYFNYLFFFLKRVVKTPAASAMFLSGQVTDGALTPLLGYLCDRFGSKKYGQRTPWYFCGLLVFIIGFSLAYLNCNVIFG
jgi:Na+/melibiose symporter-like transporter